MTFSNLCLLLVLLVLLAMLEVVCGYKHGDVVWSMKRLMIGKQGEREQAGWDEMPAGQSPRFSFDKKALFDLDPASLQQDHLYQMQVTYLRHRGVMSSFGGQGAELSSLLGHFRLGMTSSSPVPSVSWTPRRAPQCS